MNGRAWKTPTLKILRDYGITILVAIGVAVLIRTFLLEAYRIPSLAMRPTLLPGDTIFVSKWPFSTGKIPKLHRGDVVIYSKKSNDETSPRPLDFIRRIVGLPGDEIALREGQIILNGKNLTHNTKEQVPEGRQYSVISEPPFPADLEPRKIPSGTVFVIGDSRSQKDLRKQKSWEFIPMQSIKGKALWIWLSIRPPEDSASLSGQTSSGWLPGFRPDRMFRRIL